MGKADASAPLKGAETGGNAFRWGQTYDSALKKSQITARRQQTHDIAEKLNLCGRGGENDQNSPRPLPLFRPRDPPRDNESGVVLKLRRFTFPQHNNSNHNDFKPVPGTYSAIRDVVCIKAFSLSRFIS